MYDFLDIILSVVVSLSPHDVKAIQMWPYAGDTNSVKRELMLTYRWNTNGWCQDYGECLTVTDGKLMDKNGKVMLDIKNNLKVTDGTNFVLKPKEWDNPLKFSWREEKDEGTISFYDGTNVTRQVRVKLWTTEPPVEFAFCAPKHTNDLLVLQKKLLVENIHCTEIRSAPMVISFGFSVNLKDFARARTASVKIISDNSLSVNVETIANGSGYEVFENGKKVGGKYF